MQEEGWVVCRAFRKPSPSHQRHEAWNHAYYVRENNIANVRFPNSSVDDFAEEKHHGVNPNQAANFHHCFASVQELVSNQNYSDFQLTNEVLPQLDSPSISANLTTNESFHHNKGVINDDYDNERSNGSSHYLDWKNLDDLLASPVLTDPTSFASTNLPVSMPQIYQQETQNHHFQGCFQDL